MKPINKSDGIAGLLIEFRKLAKKNKKITFIGCPGWCNPFAELLSFVFRDSDKEMVYIPNLNKEIASKIEMTKYGMQPVKYTDPSTDMVVLLGGLAMPKMGIDVNLMKKMIDEITKDYPKRKIIGLCIGGVFQKYGWDKKIDFDYIIDADMSVTTYGKDE